MDCEITVLIMRWRRVDYGLGWLPPDDHPSTHSKPPPYSTSIPHAMEVFERLRQSGKWCCLEISSDYHYAWDVMLTRGYVDEDDDRKNPDHKPQIVEHGYENLAHAICAAALRAAAV